MLILVKTLKRVLIVSSVILIVVSLGACRTATPVTAVTATATIVPSLTPFIPSITPSTIPLPTNTVTPIPEAGTPPGCMIVSEDRKLYVLSDDVFFALGPTSEEIDQALVDNYPEWASYEQNVRWKTKPAKLSEIVREASFQEKFALNSEVTLVTLGENFDWQLPSERDLFLQSLTIGERLVRLWDEYSHPDNESTRARYPEVTNGATYALYVFFDYDTARLQAWCNTYQRLFGTSP